MTGEVVPGEDLLVVLAQVPDHAGRRAAGIAVISCRFGRRLCSQPTEHPPSPNMIQILGHAY
jgi:hypothetical protein